MPDDREGAAAERSQPGELDFTAKDPPPPDKLAGPPLDRPFDPEPGREKVRGRVTYGLTFFACVYAGAALVALATGWVDASDLDGIVLFFTPIITLTGTALGFYFGGRQSGVS